MVGSGEREGGGLLGTLGGHALEGGRRETNARVVDFMIVDFSKLIMVHTYTTTTHLCLHTSCSA